MFQYVSLLVCILTFVFLYVGADSRQKSLGESSEGNWFASTNNNQSKAVVIPHSGSGKSPSNSKPPSPAIKIMASSPAIPIPMGGDSSQSGFNSYLNDEPSSGSYYPPVGNSISHSTSGKSLGIGFNRDVDTFGTSAGLRTLPTTMSNAPMSGLSGSGKLSGSYRGPGASTTVTTSTPITINNWTAVSANTDTVSNTVFASSLSKQIHEASMTPSFGGRDLTSTTSTSTSTVG